MQRQWQNCTVKSVKSCDLLSENIHMKQILDQNKLSIQYTAICSGGAGRRTASSERTFATFRMNTKQIKIYEVRIWHTMADSLQNGKVK